ncbi:motility associated factor glycosyltransferase family protein [Orenia marismortui]|uniref:DUF115 domain-containing protein n=1 Tax=Orenia marismortui TaxID=46469 RepID=A0A4R8HFP0_9FIRM|nr:6-hydroxymethylpterin diphosphokinase MptE-like protein [Orenia marismortui]TDX58910.1 hypothetical protein C7959_10248 [Orenia marismortui]
MESRSEKSFKPSNQNNSAVVDSISDLEILETKIGEPTIKVKTIDNQDIILHSKYDPVKEAIRFCDMYNLNEYSKLIVIGFGLGYHVEELLKRIDYQQRIKVIVTNPKIFKVAVGVRDLSKVLEDRRVEIIIENSKDSFVDRLKRTFTSINEEQNKLIIHQPSIKAIPEGFSFLKDVIEEVNLNRENQNKFKEVIRDNIKKNIKLINDSIGVKQFKNRFKDQPIFIVSAGPSLSKNIEKLKLVQDKGIIISVDTALNPLLEKEIKPDIIVTIDPIKVNNNKFYQKMMEVDTPLLHSLGTCSEVVENYLGPKIIGLSKDDLLMDKVSDLVNKGRIETRGSVASTALDFANYLGGNPIIFVGQDFAFGENGEVHAEDTFNDEGKRETTFLRRVEGVNSDQVYTSKGYYLLLRRFEKYLEDHSDKEYIDATEGGAKIKGTIIESLNEVVKKYCKRKLKKDDIIESSFYLQYRLSEDKIEEFIEKEL